MKLNIKCKNCDMKMTIEATELRLSVFDVLNEKDWCCDSTFLVVVNE